MANESNTPVIERVPLIKRVAAVVLDHYGFQPKPRAEPAAAQPPPLKHDQPLFRTWAQASGALGLSPTKAPLGLLNSYRSWIFSCVRVISFRVAGLPLELILNEREADGNVKRTEVDAHPFVDMMWRPNPFTTRMELWLTTMNHLNLTGNAYWLVLRDRLRVPREIWPLYPQYMRIIADSVNYIKGYVYTASQPPIKFTLDDPAYRIIHFKFPNPANPYYGVGPVEAQAMAYDLDLYTEVYQRNFFQEGARPDFVLESESVVSKEDAELTWELWEERHKGVTKSWRPAILGAGLKAKPLNVSNRDLAFAALADWSRDKILAAFGVPAAKLGLVVDVNRANADAADLTFNKEAVKPQVQLIEERIEAELLPEYTGQTPKRWLEADFEDPVPEDRDFTLRERESNLRASVTGVNEEREKIGLDPVKGGEEPLVSSILTPLSAVGGGPAAPETPPEEPEEPEEPEKPEPEEPETPEEPAPGNEEGTNAVEVYAARTRLWEAYVARNAPQEAKLERELKPLFATQEKKVLARLAEVAPKAEVFFTGWSAKKVLAALEGKGGERVPNFIAQVLAVLDLDAKKWVTTLTDSITATADAEGKQAVADVGVGVWDLYDPLVQDWLKARGLDAAKGITATTKEALRKTLTAGLAAGESGDQLAARVQHVYAVADRTRALRIARTETHTSAAFGQRQGWKQTGVVEKKTWLSARDERTRETHLKADGQEVPLDANFHVGAGAGPGPGEIGLAEEDINCRCTMLAGIEKGTKATPPAPAAPAPDPALMRVVESLEAVVERFGALAETALTAKPPAPKLVRTEKRLEKDTQGRPTGTLETYIYEEGGR